MIELINIALFAVTAPVAVVFIHEACTVKDITGGLTALGVSMVAVGMATLAVVGLTHGH